MFSAMLSAFLRKKKLRRTARRLYALAVQQARSPFIYDDFSVPDTVDGRFDAVVLHVFLLLKRMSLEGTGDSAYLSQALFDALFQDMDRNLREMGVGDLSVGKHIKRMAEAYYGRAAAYEIALVSEDASALRKALLRNVYRQEDGVDVPLEDCMDAFIVYIQAAADMLTSSPFSDFLEGRLIWPRGRVSHSMHANTEVMGVI